jgi:hypothetical protein
MTSTSSIGNYLKPGRLADVLTLIQVLAYGPDSRRTEEGLQTELKSSPQTAESWVALAKQHPEFFRVRSDVERPMVALVSRFVQEEEQTPQGKKHLPLASDTTSKLMALAIELHDRETRRSQSWHVYVPIIVAVTAGVFTVVGVALKSWLGGTS